MNRIDQGIVTVIIALDVKSRAWAEVCQTYSSLTRKQTQSVPLYSL